MKVKVVLLPWGSGRQRANLFWQQCNWVGVPFLFLTVFTFPSSGERARYPLPTRTRWKESMGYFGPGTSVLVASASTIQRKRFNHSASGSLIIIRSYLRLDYTTCPKFQCNTTLECIDEGYKCDGLKDCRDGSDEWDSLCVPPSTQCDDGRWVNWIIISHK